MNELKTLYETLGFKNVITYKQSGNVIFNVNEEDPDKIIKFIESGIIKRFFPGTYCHHQNINRINSDYQWQPSIKIRQTGQASYHSAGGHA